MHRLDASLGADVRAAVPPVSGMEAILVALVTLLGLTLRLWGLRNAGIDHFDEAVYAFSALGLTQPAQPHTLYPGQVNFSPPVFFGLVALSYLAFGSPSDTAALMVNVLLGALTIVAVWWVGRTWFDARVGVSAATLVGFSQFHIAFSRTALTDVTFTLFFLIALAAIARAVRQLRPGAAIGAGLAVGLAWNTKYHGWFACLVAFAAVVAYLATNSSRRLASPRLLGVLVITAVVALAAYVPWALFVQSQPGGYAALTKVHRSMLSMNVLGNAWQQIQMQLYYDGPLSRAAFPLAMLAAALVGRSHRPALRGFLLALAGIVAATLTCGSSITLALLAAAALPTLWRWRQRFEIWMLVAWVALWIFSLPLYHPYARLALPLVVALCLLASITVARLTGAVEPSAAHSSARPLLAAGAALLVALAPPLLAGNRTPWSDSRDFARIADALTHIIPAGEPVVVFGEPPLAFYLHLAGRPAFTREQDPAKLASTTTPLWIITGEYADRSPQLRKGLAALRPQLQPLATFRAAPGDVRLLDDFTPAAAVQHQAHPDETYDVALYRLRPRTVGP